jgi:EmrB/QacA subfamily drug resistance transporter
MQTLNRKDTVLIVSSVAVSILIASLDLMVVATSLPTMIAELNGFDYYAWPIISFSLTLAVATPIMGKLCDIYGFKSIYLFGLLVFLIGSVTCGVAGAIGILIVARGVQGIGGAVLISNSLTVVGLLFPPEKRTKYMGILGTVGIAATIFGPSLGGYITTNFDWRWIFWINVPIIALALILIVFAHFPKFGTDAESGRKIDFIGTLALTLAVVPLLLVFTWAGEQYAWRDPVIVALGLFSAAMIAAFIFVERAAKNPVMPLSMFANKTFLISSINMFLLNGALSGALTLVPLYLQSVLDLSSKQSGNFMMPMMIGMVIAMLLGGALTEKTKHYKWQTACGLATAAAGCWLLTGLTIDTSMSTIMAMLTVFGFGAGLAIPVFTSVAQSSFEESQMGTVTAGIQFFKNIGTSMVPSLLSAAMMRRISTLLQDMDWRGIPSEVIAPLQTSDNIGNPGFIKGFTSAAPEEIREQIQAIVHDLTDLLSNAVSYVFWGAVVLVLIALIIQLFSKEISLTQKR